MPTQREILDLLARESSETAPIHRNKMAERFGETSYRSFQTPLDRLVKLGQLKVTADHEYWITDVGQQELAGVSAVAEELDEEKARTTEYQQFLKLGQMHGVSPAELLKVVADHVWKGGDYNDLDWVAKAFDEMGVRSDLSRRWWHSWRVFLHQPIPAQMPATIAKKEEVEETKVTKKEGKGYRDYILDLDDKPVRVGDGLGDMDYQDAMELSKLRTARGNKGRGNEATSPGESLAAKAVDKIIGDMQAGKPTDETSKFIEQFKAISELMGIGSKPDSSEEMSKLVNLYTSLKEIFESNKPQAITGSATQWIVDKATGEVKPWQPGQAPVIMFQQPQQQSQYPYTPIEMKDKDGNPMILDLSTFIRLEEHKDKQRHDQESHETKQEIAKSFKDLIGKATSALGHMAEEK